MKAAHCIWVFVTALAVAGCLGDDEDDSSSEECVDARRKYNHAKALRDEAAKYDAPTAELDAALDEFVNKHWKCFK